MNKLIIGCLVISMAFAGWGSQMAKITMWRGETRTEILHDAAQIGLPPSGISIRVGVAEEIRYRTRPFGAHYATMADRVEWGSMATGLRVIEVSVGEAVKPGYYAIGDLELTVIDRVLPQPKDWKYHLDLWQHPWAVARYFDTKPFTDAHFAAMAPIWKLLASAGQKTLTVTLLDRPWNHQCYDAYHTMVRHIKCADGSWKFDYSILDRYVEFGRSCGLGPDIACYTMCPWGYMVNWEDESGVPHSVKAVPGTKEFEEYWGDFLVDFSAHMKAKGWLNDTYICMDERSPDDVKNIERLVREKAPGFKVFLAGNVLPSKFEGAKIDNACFALHLIDEKYIAEAVARRATGMKTTIYVCCGPQHPNTMCHNEIEEAFWLGAFPGVVGLDGFLRWAWNSWPKDPMHDASFSTSHGDGWGSGDTYLVYPNGAPSLRFLELRNGIVCAEKMRILREQGCVTDGIKDLTKIYDRLQAIGNKSNFRSIRQSTLKAVNRVK